VGTMCEELGRHVNMDLLRHLLHFLRACCFVSSAAAPWGYKRKRSPLRTLRPLAQSVVVYSSSSLRLKKREQRDILGA
jgi:hypothetical protein